MTRTKNADPLHAGGGQTNWGSHSRKAYHDVARSLLAPYTDGPVGLAQPHRGASHG
jgi:hypothetical protein